MPERGVKPSYAIVSARPHDLRLLPDIERAAAALLVGHAPPSILNETTSEDDFRQAQADGRLWVALAGNIPVGFAHVEVLDSGVAHLEEMDVHPDHGRRGLGTRLVEAVCAWAASAGYPAVTLTTFRDVPWNMPFYARLGFHEVPPRELSADVLAVVEDEARRGLDPARRVVMRRGSAVRRVKG
jgi:GNAT superfamily N-acetyltransferase